MKRMFSVFLAFALLAALFSGCRREEAETEPLRVCADLSIGGFLVNSEEDVKQAVEQFLASAADRGGPKDVEVEYLPREGAARETAVVRVRTEIMSGKGPDLFLCNCAAPEPSTETQALFQFPEKAMENGTFLPLDDLIGKARFLEWEKLLSPVMDAGKNQEGQMLLPLAYSLPVVCFPAPDVEPYPASTTWAEAAKGDDPVLAASMEPIVTSLFPLYSDGYAYFGCTWRDPADYSGEKLLFSEEELLQRVREAVALRQGESSPLPHFRGVMDAYLFQKDGSLDPAMREMRQGISTSDPVTMVPLYCDQGGAVAAVRAFAGINRNTERPEDAFFLLDLLLSGELQERSPLYTEIWNYGACPTHEDVSFTMPESPLAAFREVRSQITGARFYTSLDSLIASILSQYEGLGENAGDAALQDLVSEAYLNMEMLLAES